MTASGTSRVRNPFTQPLPLTGEKRKKRLPFMFLSPSGERLGEGVSP